MIIKHAEESEVNNLKKAEGGIGQLVPAVLLLVILVAGLGIRLVMAPNTGFVDDMMLFQAWSRSAMVNGLGNVYDSSANAVIDGREVFVPTPNYLPVYLYFMKFRNNS